MQKSILITLLAAILANESTCMKRQRTTDQPNTGKKQCLSIGPADSMLLPEEIIQVIRTKTTESFVCDQDTPREIAHVIKKIRLVNKSWRDFLDDPKTIRTLISNASATPYDRGFLANSPYLTKFPPIENYMKQSEKLIRNIATLDDDQIKAAILAGADINYCFSFSGGILIYPILTMLNSRAMPYTENIHSKFRLLLDLGADQNIIVGKNTLLGCAIAWNNIKLIELLLEYNPCNKHIVEAVKIGNVKAAQLILQQKDIPTQDIERAKEIARKNGDDIFIQLLDEYIAMKKPMNYSTH